MNSQSVAAAVLVVTLVVGCTSDDGAARSDGSTSTPSDAYDDASAAVVADYEEFWRVVLLASDPPNPDHAELERYAGGTELERTRNVLVARRQVGELVRGNYEHTVSVVSIEETQATIRDCLILHTVVFDATTETEKARDSEQPQPVVVSLELGEGTWRVTLIEPDSSACDSPVRPTSTTATG